ncbi:THAP domain-containing protein 9 [Temnothorax longispinosus]|uniref:THAP domain-containing protein 9 n=1 Tax=Temnothorax longispinosus TaxID=300112 RepID=A0A4S2KVY7_9HYME|nr:THAP domain-containing protein 9 [Temnothorax longispinosus]
MDLDVQNATPSTSKEENCNGNLQLPGRIMGNDAEIAGPGTSSTRTKASQQANISSDNSLRKMELRLKNKKLKAQIKTLRETIRRLRKDEGRNYNRRKPANAEDADQFETLCIIGSKLLPVRFVKLLLAQINAQVKRNRGRRYDPQFKKFALSLYFLSPRNYRELKKSISLPSVRSLQLLTQMWNITPGLNDKIFDALALKIKSLPPMDRHCILCADEMSLKSHLFYNVSQDEIIGFEDNGKEKSSIPAKSVFVIMARSIAGNWKLPLCYCFVETTCQNNVLKNIIFETIIKLRMSGAIVHALVTDMGSNFIHLSRDLGISTENSTFLVEEEKVLYLFDTPHLLKATRNNLLKHDFQFNNKIASWTHIVQFYTRDSKQWIKFAPKLSKCHIEPSGFQRTKVKLAVQVFSNPVAAGMCTHMSSGSLPSEAVGTIDLIDHFDKLFDILNSFTATNLKQYGKVFTGSETQFQFLEKIICFLKCIKVINKNGTYVKVKCFECWQITIKSTIKLWEILKCYNFPYLRTRRINQDCLENFFDSIRQQCNSSNPTPIQFVRAFKKLFSITFLKHPDTQNYAPDEDDMLNLIGTPNSISSTVSEFVPSSTCTILEIPNPDYYTMNLPEKNAFKYVCGYLIKKCLEIHSCDTCIAYVNKNKALDDTLDDTTYSSFRAYENNETNLFGNLHIASDDFSLYIYKLEEIFVKNLKKNCFQKNIGGYLFQLAQDIIFGPPCPHFPTIFLIKLFLRMRIYFILSEHNKSCKEINRKNRKLLNILHL